MAKMLRTAFGSFAPKEVEMNSFGTEELDEIFSRIASEESGACARAEVSYDGSVDGSMKCVLFCSEKEEGRLKRAGGIFAEWRERNAELIAHLFERMLGVRGANWTGAYENGRFVARVSVPYSEFEEKSAN